jgi:hypothetical protein
LGCRSKVMLDSNVRNTFFNQIWGSQGLKIIEILSPQPAAAEMQTTFSVAEMFFVTI